MSSKASIEIVKKARELCGPSDGSAQWIWNMEAAIGELAGNERAAINAISLFNGKFFKHEQNSRDKAA